MAVSITDIHKLQGSIVDLRGISDRLAVLLNGRGFSPESTFKINKMIDGIDAEISRGHRIVATPRNEI